MSPQQPTPFETPFSDRHRVETPEQIYLEFAVAGIGSRFLALAVDTLIQGAAGLLIFIILAVSFGRVGFLRGWRLASLWLLAGVVAIVFLIYFGYFAFFEILWNGQTPGKRFVGIRVIKETGRPLSAVESIGRNLMRIIDQFPGFYAIGVVAAMCNSQSKRIGDYVAGSLVIREQKMADIERSWIAAPAPAPGVASGTQPLDLQDFTLIDAFLMRRADLEPRIRHKLAFDILRKLRPKLDFPAQSYDAPEETLESLAHRYREFRRE